MAYININTPYNLIVGPEVFTITADNIVSATQSSIVLQNGLDTFMFDGNFVVNGSTFTSSSNITGITYQRGGATQFTASEFVLGMNDYFDLTNNASTATDLIARVLNTNDVISGSYGADTIYGYSGNDIIYGYNSNDTLNGHFGNDTVDGGSGNDVVRGGSGDDTLDGGAGNDTVRGDKGNDLIRGGEGDDYVNGHEGNDIVRGGYGNDLVRGGSENDVVIGEHGDDDLFGDKGNDLLAGAQGADIFYFSADSGQDRIADYDSQDFIAIYGISGITSFTDLNLSVSAGNTIVDFGAGNQVQVDNITDMTADDFIFI